MPAGRTGISVSAPESEAHAAHVWTSKCLVIPRRAFRGLDSYSDRITTLEPSTWHRPEGPLRHL